MFYVFRAHKKVKYMATIAQRMGAGGWEVGIIIILNMLPCMLPRRVHALIFRTCEYDEISLP